MKPRALTTQPQHPLAAVLRLVAASVDNAQMKHCCWGIGATFPRADGTARPVDQQRQANHSRYPTSSHQGKVDDWNPRQSANTRRIKGA